MHAARTCAVAGIAAAAVAAAMIVLGEREDVGTESGEGSLDALLQRLSRGEHVIDSGDSGRAATTLQDAHRKTHSLRRNKVMRVNTCTSAPTFSTAPAATLSFTCAQLSSALHQIVVACCR